MPLPSRTLSPLGPAPARVLSATGRFQQAGRNKWASLPVGEDARESAFAPHRERILFPVAIAGAAVLLPLALLNYAQGRSLLGGLLLLVVLMLAIDAIALRRRRAAPIPFALLLLPGAASVALSLTSQGIYGAFWAFPMVMFSYFVLPRRLANVTGVSVLAMTATLLYAQQDAGIAVRIALSLGLCILTINIILNILESLHAKLLAQSLVDPLTGAFNRRHMERCVGYVVERMRRSRAPVVGLVLDLDHFKSINDVLGHETGDRVLKAVVSIVDERSRKLDLLFRMGGEEFLLLLPDTRISEAMRVAEHLRAAIARAPIVDGRVVTVSVGAAELRPGEDAGEWLKRADEALYRAKNGGRNRVAV